MKWLAALVTPLLVATLALACEGEEEAGTATRRPAVTPAVEASSEGEDEQAGWLTYTSDVYRYEFAYPPEAEIAEAPKEAFSLPGEESQAGATVEDVYRSYTGQICVRVVYEFGYIAISAPPNQEGLPYVMCLRSGVGTCPPPDTGETEFVDREETLLIEGRTYTAQGFEIQCPGKTLTDDGEMLRVSLEDGTTIEYGARPLETATFEDYQQIRDVLLKIIQSYRKLPEATEPSATP